MEQITVRFQPSGRQVRVALGTSIAEAARSAGIHINNLCGGEGVCGECRVRVIKGDYEMESSAESFFSDDELEQGYVLACQSKILGDIEIDIPLESTIEEAKILKDEIQEQAVHGLITENVSYPIKPLARKIYLELSPPTHDDNITDLERISRELRKKIGWHSYDISLDCLRTISTTLRESDWKITATVVKDKNRYRIQQVEPYNTVDKNFGIAVDVGTTTVVAQIVDLRTGEVIASEGVPNKQAQYGEDVISRMIFACQKDGLEPIHNAIIENINELIDMLINGKDIDRSHINAMVAAGNTTMSHLLLNLSPCSIRLEPYVPTADVYPQIYAKDLSININPGAIIEVIPSVASYVGGDIVAGVMVCGIPDNSEVQGLIDIGTNGEIAIGNEEWLVCCSASAGPAFEGGGTRCGMRATKGAIEKIEIRDGNVKYQTIGNSPPRGICGSGLIDCIYELVKNGIIGSTGKFNRDLKDPRITYEDDIPQYIIAYGDETDSGDPIVITELDIDNLIKSKGAVFAAIKSLVDYIGLGFDQLERFYVAGGFGNYLNIRKAINIGLLPDIPEERIAFIGNSSLSGARMSLISEAAFEKCISIAKSMTNIELSVYQPFMDEYVAALFLPHTDKRLFPSVDY